MATIVLCHTVYGLRDFEREAADRLTAAGHRVVTPDVYDGRVAASVDEGFAIRREIGWKAIAARAEAATADVPADAVLGGFSMGAAVAAHLWAQRPQTRAVLFLHAVAQIPENTHPGLPLQLHLADPDEYESPQDIAEWQKAAQASGIAFEMFRYTGVGHLFSDPTVADYGRQAAELTWARVEAFLAKV